MAQEERLFKLNSIYLHPAELFLSILRNYFFRFCGIISLDSAEYFLSIPQNYYDPGLIYDAMAFVNLALFKTWQFVPIIVK